MLRLALISILALAPVAVPAQETAPLAGRIKGSTYIAATGAFSIVIPVDQALGGKVSDTQFMVVFQDAFNTYITIVGRPLDATERWELSTQGTKAYLTNFLKSTLLPEFRRANKDTKVESVLFAPTMFDGSVVVYLLLPGGSMFASQHTFGEIEGHPPVAKRGNLVFIKNGFIYVISTELAEKVTEGSAYTKTTKEEDVLLRERLSDIVNDMVFQPAPHSPDP
jgi:hypothetical protein